MNPPSSASKKVTKITPYDFSDIPSISATSLKMLENITNAWMPILGGKDILSHIADTIGSFCKVWQMKAPSLMKKKDATDKIKVNIKKSPFSIGRKKNNDLVLTDAGVSGIHAIIDLQDNRWVVIDHDSVNGTFLNNKIIEKSKPYVIKNGDVITIMNNELIVKLPKAVARKSRVSITFESIESSASAEFESDYMSLIKIKLHSMGEKIELLIPTSMIRKLLISLVGIHYIKENTLQPLSDVEKGLFEFIILKVLESMHDKVFGETPIFLLGEVQSPARPNHVQSSDYAFAKFLFTFEDMVSDIWVRIPYISALQWNKTFGDFFKWSDEKKRTFKFMSQRWNWITWKIGIVLGKIDFTLKEIDSLEEGDVVLLPHNEISLDDEGILSGNTILDFPFIPFKGMANLNYDGSYKLTFKEFFKEKVEATMDSKEDEKTESRKNEELPGKDAELGDESSTIKEKPLEKDTDEASEHVAGEGATEEESSEYSAEEVPVSNLPLTMVVELDRVNLTMEQLVNLAPGQIISLKHLPSDPVLLSIQGRIVGKGQVVKIQDELGIKILYINK